MLSVAEARALMLAATSALGSERVAIDSAHGRILAAPLRATRDQPPFDASAMDGYAFASSEAPRDFTLVGEAAAGHAFARALGPGEAARISTGAPIPAGADGVLIQEEARLESGALIAARVARGRHVRPRGGDFRGGDLLLDRGRLLDPITVALAASAGAAHLDVMRRPRIGVMASGDEVVAPGMPARADQVYESGSFAVCGLVERWGGTASRAAALTDDEDAIARAAEHALGACDLLVLIGGASVGPRDHARAAFQRVGVDVRVGKVAVRPGKPTWFGVSAAGRVLGLPGNPASAIVCAYLFLRPLLEALLARDPEPCFRQALLAKPVGENGPRETYLRASVDAAGRLSALDDQDSSLLSVFARANALLQRPPMAEAAMAGQAVCYLPLDLAS